MLQDTISSAVIDVYISIFSLFCKTLYGSNISYDTLTILIYICIQKTPTNQKKPTKPPNAIV